MSSSSPPPSSTPQSEPPPPQPPQPQSPIQPEPQPQTPPSPPTAIPTSNPNPSPSPNPPIIQALSYSPLKKPQPIPWSHEETLNLIKAYQEKWYSLKRGQLKASQWEEVAITVAARCGLDEPSKSGTQCRHKIEKLRKRYRAEKQKLPPSFNYHNHPWIYFSMMDQLERGPLPISAIAPQHHHHHGINPKNEGLDYVTEDDDDDDDDDHRRSDLRFGSLRNLRADNNNNNNNHNSSHYERRVDGFFRIGRNSGNGYARGAEFEDGLNFKKRKSYWEGQNGEEEEEEEEVIGDEDNGEDDKGRRSSDLVRELGAQIREFADKFVKVEKKKLDMIRENEMLRNEMENKRMEMIFVSQQKTVELINKAFDVASSAIAHKNMKMKMTNNNPDL